MIKHTLLLLLCTRIFASPSGPRQQQSRPVSILTRDGYAINCNVEQPCPAGSTCRFNPLAAGVKVCYSGIAGIHLTFYQ
jgi:hypothetical protein